MATLAFDPATQQALRDQLLAGVERLADMGAEGTVAVFGDHAVSVLQDSDGKSVVAAADNGTGRLVMAGKTEFVNMAHAEQHDTARFAHNTLDWVSHGRGLGARIVTDIEEAANWLAAQGYSRVTWRSDWEQAMDQADVLVSYFINPSPDQQRVAASLLARGGGLFLGYNGWAFSYAAVTPLTAGSNAVLRDMGLSWTDDVSWTFDGTITRGTPTGNAAYAGRVMATPHEFTDAQQTEISVAVQATFASVPAANSEPSVIRARVLANASSAVPTPESPISDPNERVRLRLESAVLKDLPVSELFVHRTATSYGPIPPVTPRVTRTLTLTASDANREYQWLSTGLYAAPGEVVTVNVPPALVRKGWYVKVGSHLDDISHHSDYLRMPSGISRDFALDAATVFVGSVYGGMLYVVKPETDPGTNVTYSVTFRGAVEAPYFVLGETTDQEWVETLRYKPAPYAELAAPNVILTLHSEDIRNLLNPTAVMRYWSDRLAEQDDLANFPQPRMRAERINDDLSISYGWMHAGYPVMAFAHNVANMVDSDPGDDWGFFHEFGHNHQSAHWTFETEGEVTVNIFTLRAFDGARSLPSDDGGAFWTSPGRADRLQSFVERGRKRDQDAFDSLTTYAQLRAGFGWEPFETFFRQYQTDAESELPVDDQQKRDQWVTRFSRIVGRNLGPFFQGWGFDPSPAAMQAVADLPPWSLIEAINPHRDSYLFSGDSITFAPANDFVDLFHEPLKLQFTNASPNGTLSDLGDGLFRYDPVAGRYGSETLKYTLTNAHGGSAEGRHTFHVLDPQKPWHNPSLPEDVSGDGIVAPIDVLSIINYLNQLGPGLLSDKVSAEPPFYDVNGDRQIAPLDALLIINRLNDAAPVGEGEDDAGPHVVASIVEHSNGQKTGVPGYASDIETTPEAANGFNPRGQPPASPTDLVMRDWPQDYRPRRRTAALRRTLSHFAPASEWEWATGAADDREVEDRWLFAGAG